ncbi:MAG: hypothetical protein HY755_05000 [Nitrospirae bacterium]|nr:hypothetical protein [Nitrospirota bacterium]
MKKAFYIGAIIGGVLGISVALGMDILLGNSLGGGWAEAVAGDINRLFNASFPSNHYIVFVGVVFAISIIVALGALMGGISTVMLAGLFKALTKEK